MVKSPSNVCAARTALRGVHECVARRAVRITLKAMNEMAALDPPADIDDLMGVLERLEEQDWAGRVVSRATGEPMHVFKPATPFGLLYIKVIVRRECVVVSFHEDEVES